MATKKKTLQTFNITAKISVLGSVSIEAANFEEAVVKAKELTWNDFVESSENASFDDVTLEGFQSISSNYDQSFKFKDE